MDEELKKKIEEQLITLTARIVTNVSLHRKDLNSAFVTGTTNDLCELFQAERIKAKEEVADHYEQSIEASYYDLKPTNDSHAYVQKTRKRLIQLRQSLASEKGTE